MSRAMGFSTWDDTDVDPASSLQDLFDSVHEPLSHAQDTCESVRPYVLQALAHSPSSVVLRETLAFIDAGIAQAATSARADAADAAAAAPWLCSNGQLHAIVHYLNHEELLIACDTATPHGAEVPHDTARASTGGPESATPGALADALPCELPGALHGALAEAPLEEEEAVATFTSAPALAQAAAPPALVLATAFVGTRVETPEVQATGTCAADEAPGAEEGERGALREAHEKGGEEDEEEDEEAREVGADTREPALASAAGGQLATSSPANEDDEFIRELEKFTLG